MFDTLIWMMATCVYTHVKIGAGEGMTKKKEKLVTVKFRRQVHYIILFIFMCLKFCIIKKFLKNESQVCQNRIKKH